MVWFLPMLMAGAGAMADKENPLRGAAIGAGLGLTGGAAAGALGAGGATGAAGGGLLAEGAAGAAGAGATTAGTGGLLAEGASLGGASLGTSGAGLGTTGLLGGTEGATMLGTGAVSPTAAGVSGGGAIAEQAAAPVIERGTQAGVMDTANFKTGGLLGNAGKYGKNAMTAYNVYNQAKPPQQAAPAPMPMQSRPLDLSAIINDSSAMQQYNQAENERRKQLMAQYAQYAGGY